LATVVAKAYWTGVLRGIFWIIPGGHVPKIIYRDRQWEVPTNITVRDAIRKGGLNPETVLATRDGQLITEDVHVKANDVIKLIAVISGGKMGFDIREVGITK
jgi:sulfur carrier protein ThiS